MWRVRLRRLWYRRRVAGTPLEDCWRKTSPSTGSDWRQASFLVCDAEMSSLEVNEGELLSIGWVAIENGSVVLDSAAHHLVRAQGGVGQSATIHQLRDCELEQAEEGGQVLQRFLQAAAGRVLVFHNAALDMAFLDRLARREYGAPLLLPVADTLLLEKGLRQRRGQPIKPGDLRLDGCRRRYNLPPYPVHNALLDALATAELLLAHARCRSGAGKLALASLLGG